ncbi:MAG: hypothetical protein ACI4P6_00910 [Candidatus Spyradosoma sp.]
MASKKISPLFFAFLIPVIVVAGAAALIVVRHSRGEELSALPADAFERSPETLRGNVYSLSCAIDRQLAQSDRGRVLAVKRLEGGGRVAVYVPPSLDRNFEIGQRFVMTVRVKDNALHVEALKKF